ncbi:MAG: daunorubicin transporter ATP-binding protein [Symbiobacteriaceae bacterium]|jgi:ABC-2 type transport system ATP-binding protein|nr:daunorubicin transporter ATP-binding protein [Symbiobacteriaceae bacterium]
MRAIETHDLTKTFMRTESRPGLAGALRDLFDRRQTTFVAVDGINLTVDQGEIVGYIGANGAGKSTTIKMLTGILQPTAGTLNVNGFDPHRQRERFVSTIGVVFGQRSQLWWDIAVQESFRLLQRIYRVSDHDFKTHFIDGVAEVLEIGPLMATPVRKLSLGQRMRCEMAAALLHRPSLLFLDEPTIGLDVSVKLRIREFLKELNHRYETTVLLTTHDLSDIEALCRRVIMLDKGRIVYDGTLTDLRQRWAGDRTVRVVFGADVDPGAIGRACEREEETTFRFRLADDEDLSDLLPALVRLGPIRDITVLEAGMEEIVRKMYETGGATA